MKTNSIDKKIQRNLAKQAGFYDGRFRCRIVEDKRKKESKMMCRKFNQNVG